MFNSEAARPLLVDCKYNIGDNADTFNAYEPV